MRQPDKYYGLLGNNSFLRQRVKDERDPTKSIGEAFIMET